MKIFKCYENAFDVFHHRLTWQAVYYRRVSHEFQGNLCSSRPRVLSPKFVGFVDCEIIGITSSSTSLFSATNSTY